MRAALTRKRPFTHEREIFHELFPKYQTSGPAIGEYTDNTFLLIFEVTRRGSGERLLFVTSDGAEYTHNCIVMGLECSPVARSIFFRYAWEYPPSSRFPFHS